MQSLLLCRKRRTGSKTEQLKYEDVSGCSFKKQVLGSQFSAAGRKRIFLYDGGKDHYSRYAMRDSLMPRFVRSFESGGFLNKKQGALWAPCFFDNYPNIFFKSASGVEMGVKLNFSTSTFKIFGDTNAGKLGPM